MLNLQKNKGFSLAEMMVVMLMLSIIFAAAAPILTKRASQKSDTPGETLPKGSVIIWSGEISKIPSGWHLCDGSHGTPDLRNRFVLCAGIDGTSTYTTGLGRKSDESTTTPTGNAGVGAKGGYDWIELSTNEMPSHSHSGSAYSAGSHSHSGSTSSGGSHTHSYYFWASYYGGACDSATGNGSGAWGRETTASGSHSHSFSTNSAGSHEHSVVIANTGSGLAHENKPPFYALAYIMKL